MLPWDWDRKLCHLQAWDFSLMLSFGFTAVCRKRACSQQHGQVKNWEKNNDTGTFMAFALPPISTNHLNLVYRLRRRKWHLEDEACLR